MRARLAALALLGLLAVPAFAQDPNYNTTRTSAPLPPTVSFRNQPTWIRVPGTQNVMMIQQDQRPTYDMFEFNKQYFIYNDGYWYRSDLVNGPYSSLELNAIPPEFKAVPEDSWISYPADWKQAPASTMPTTTPAADWVPTINYSSAPHWLTVPGSARVYYVKKDVRPKDYDLFRWDSRYYTYQRGNWYTSTAVNGPYELMLTNEVPTALRTVKKTYWVNYPTGWKYQQPGTLNATQTVRVETKTK